MKLLQWSGVTACLLIICSCFFNWTWYPDIEEYFTGFYTYENRYGKPGMLLIFFSAFGILFYLLGRNWSKRTNLIFAGINLAYAGAKFFQYSFSDYGNVPEKQFAIFVMLFASIAHLIISVLLAGMREIKVPTEPVK